MEAVRRESPGAVHVVSIVGVASIDEDVARGEQRNQRLERGIDDRRRHHQPHHPWRRERRDEVLRGRRADGTFGAESVHRIPGEIVDDALMAAAHQPAHPVGAHAPEPDHSELHPHASYALTASRSRRGVRASSSSAPAMCRAEIFAASISSAGFPEPGISRTARCTKRTISPAEGRAGDGRHANEVERRGEKRRERGREGDEPDHLHADRGGDHLLLGDVHLEEAFGSGLLEVLGVRRIAHLRVQHDDVGAGGAQCGERLAVSLARGERLGVGLPLRLAGRAELARLPRLRLAGRKRARRDGASRRADARRAGPPSGRPRRAKRWDGVHVPCPEALPPPVAEAVEGRSREG